MGALRSSVLRVGPPFATPISVSDMDHPAFCTMAFGAVTDRSIRTPTSARPDSTPQCRRQPKKDPLIRVPGQQPVHELATRPHDLARQPDKGIHKGLELDAEHPLFFRAVPVLPAAGFFRQA